jgi:L-threonylcarbamoyladenylate synthase
MSNDAMLEPLDAERLAGCLEQGGVAVFPADTVYGLCCDPEDERAVERLYSLKRRPAERPAAVMFFTLERALEELGDVTASERRAIGALLPGPVTLLLPNRNRRFLPACGPDPDTLGVRVPALTSALAALAALERGVMQSSANISGGADARRLGEVPEELLEGADLVLDGGELPGTPSTVLDLRSYESDREWRVLRAGALPDAVVARALDPR